MQRGRLFFEWRGLYSSPSSETLRRQKKWGGPSPVLPLKGALSIPFLPKSMYCSHAQRGFLQGLAASWPFASGRPGGGGRGGGRAPKKKKKRVVAAFFFGASHPPPPQPQGPVALCLLSPLSWPLVFPFYEAPDCLCSSATSCASLSPSPHHTNCYEAIRTHCNV